MVKQKSSLHYDILQTQRPVAVYMYLLTRPPFTKNKVNWIKFASAASRQSRQPEDNV